jgi:GT2 family glycosyltransferase
MSEPLLSLVTGTRNRPDAVATLARSALAHAGDDFELLIADASARPGGFASADPRIEVIPETTPLGYPRGYNALFRRARGRWICFLNDDAELAPGFGAALRGAIERRPEVDLFCLPVVERGEAVAQVLLCMGMPYACMGAVRREAGCAVGWFDEGYRFYGPDSDLALRLIAAGRRLAPAPGARVIHHRADDAERAGNAAFFAQDNARLLALWRPRRAALRRRYRRSSYRYFRALEVRASSTYGGEALVVPASGEPPSRPGAELHRVKAPGWWLGI